MKEFIEKLTGRLEEKRNEKYINGVSKFPSREQKVFDIAETIVNQLAEEHNNGWINADVESPTEDGKYLVYYRKWTDGNYLPKFDETEIRILRYRNNDWVFPTYGDTEAEKDIHREVLAWQPLPPKYEPKGE